MSADSDEAKIDVIKTTDLFQDLSPEEIEAVAAIMTPREFTSGTAIMKEGEMGHSIFFMGTGRVEVSKSLTMKFGEDDYRETEKTLITLSAERHAVFGEMALVADAPRSATINALTDCLLYEINREDFLKLAFNQPSVGFKVTLRIAALLSKRLKSSNDDVVRLTTALSIALSP